jgi:hypothetical protein
MNLLAVSNAFLGPISAFQATKYPSARLASNATVIFKDVKIFGIKGPFIFYNEFFLTIIILIAFKMDMYIY